MASIKKRVRASGATTFRVRWYNPDGSRGEHSGFPTKKAAEDWAAIHVEPKRRRGIHVDPSTGKVLFRDVAAKWLASRHDLKATTRAAYADALAPTSEHTVKRHKRLANLRIDNTFGDYPINAIRRDDISDWVGRMLTAGKKPSTIRNAYFLVKQVLAQAVADGRLDSNPADYVKLPTDHNTGHVRAVDDPAMFLTPAQVASLVAATPWPFSVATHLAAWGGLRAAELAGLRVGDVHVPKSSLNPNASAKPGTVRVEQTIAWTGATAAAMAPKTKGSRHTVPLTPATTVMLRDYLAVHPRGDDPTAPLFPGVRLLAPRPTGVATPPDDTGATTGGGRAKATRQAAALADLTTAEAGERLVLDWTVPYRHATFYKAVFRPAVLRANRCAETTGDEAAKVPPQFRWHGLRHTYASLCIAAGRPPLEVARFMGHAKVATTLGVYAHLYEDDHADAMAALAALETEPSYGPNVVPLWG
ncbi:tyrosine-type recombinase/integrase [Mycolicibacterium sp.]|uniref:tyrosine-type recombinase/integrase n=1 Tax=Mycolicibacterium sp. TaxID=2320850 RepID=UPI003D1068D3